MAYCGAILLMALLNLISSSCSYHTGYHIRPKPNNWYPSHQSHQAPMFEEQFPNHNQNTDHTEDFSQEEPTRNQRQIFNNQNSGESSDESNEFKPYNHGFTWGDPDVDDDFYVFDASRELDHQVATSTARTTTDAVPGMETTQSSCEESCKTTREYNPACGDDGRTYYNPARLSCAKICGKQVTLQHFGRCSVWPSEN